jgi:hypothetical protein
MLNRLIAASILVLATGIVGCTSSAPNPGQGFVADGPHSGLMVPLPGNAGFAEIFNEEASASAANSRNRGHVPKMVVVYFLGPDKKTALSTAPTGVGLKFLGEAAGAPITLGPAPDSKDPSGAGRFASPVGDFDLAGRRAELTADLGGQKFVQEFQALR